MEMSDIKEGALGNPNCLGWKIETVQNTGKINPSEKYQDCKKHVKANKFQGRKIQEKLSNIK